jgi:hypothetical protein
MCGSFIFFVIALSLKFYESSKSCRNPAFMSGILLQYWVYTDG